MSAAGLTSRGRAVGLSIVGLVVASVGYFGGALSAAVAALALLGAPLFAVMGGAAVLAWFSHSKEGFHYFRLLAPTVLDSRFAGSPVLVTIPLFTFVGYVLAEAKTAERLVRASTALVGWLPGGLAIVCIIASAVFTLFTGGSGVTIIAIGGLLYPALRREGYSEKFSLGVVTTGGSVGLLLPYSLPLMIYCLVAGVDMTMAFKAVLLPGLLVVALLAAYAAYVGITEKIPRTPPSLAEIKGSLWELKWELGIPLLLIVGMKTNVTQIDEAAAAVALYAVLIEVYAYKDLSFKKDLPRIAKSSMTLAGAVILILAMANAMVNYVVQEKIPDEILTFMLSLGLKHTWQFLLVMNVFLLILGMLMEGFSAIIVAVPLILPFAAQFHIAPFHLAMILLNLELAYCTPPLGLNLFIASFRFNRPVLSLYKVVLPFVGVLAAALLIVSYVPRLSTIRVEGRIKELREEASAKNRPPTGAWLLECVQGDRLNPQPCTDVDKERFPGGRMPAPKTDEPKIVPEASDPPAADSYDLYGGPDEKKDEGADPYDVYGGPAKDASSDASSPTPAATVRDSYDLY